MLRLLTYMVCFSFLLSMLAGCKHDQTTQSPQHGHAHGASGGDDAEEKVAQVTLWDEKYEIFLEHPFIVANSPVTFITHISDMLTFEPKREGKIVFILEYDGEAPIMHFEDQPAREGIYLPELVFPQKGECGVTLAIIESKGEHRIKLPAMTVYGSDHDVVHASAAEAPDGISYLKEQQWRLLTKTDLVQKRNLIARKKYVGKVTACPDLRATVTSPVAGRIMILPNHAMPAIGTLVEKDQVLINVQPPLAGAELLSFYSTRTQLETQCIDYKMKAAEAEAQLEKSKIGLKLAENSYQRIRKLHEQNAKSKKEFDEASLQVEKAKSDLFAAQMLLENYRKASTEINKQHEALSLQEGFPAVELKSTISGMITSVQKTGGEYVTPDEDIFSILDTKYVYVTAQIPESDFEIIHQSTDALVELLNRPNDYTSILNKLNGKVVYIGREVDERSRTVPLTYKIINRDDTFLIGMTVHMHVQAAVENNALAILKSALVDEDGQMAVFIQLAGETFEKRYVKLGIEDGDYIQVLEGLEEGERVVTDGAYPIRLASVSSSIPAHGHAH